MGERIVAANPIAIAGGRVIASPFQFYLDGADNIRLEGWNTCSGAAVEVQGRAIDDQGNTQTFNMVLTLTADRVRNRRDFAAVRGYILNLVAVARDAEPCIGQTFVRVSIIRGFTGATIVLGVLLQGYVTSQHGLGWPGSPIESSIVGGGYNRAIVATQPNIGQQVSETVPTGAVWELQTFLASFTATADVGNRHPHLILDRGSSVFAVMAAARPMVALETLVLTWGRGLVGTEESAVFRKTMAIPMNLQLLAGYRLRTFVDGMFGGDVWTGAEFNVREWLEIE